MKRCETAPLLGPSQHTHETCIDVELDDTIRKETTQTWSRYLNEIGINCLSGVIAFMLTSTIAVSTANVLVGSSGELSAYVANAIDMHLLGTALMCIYLSWRSTVPYAMGAIDASVVPILAEMAQSISHRLNHDMEIVVPTVLVAAAISSVFIGTLLVTLGTFRLTSIVNYLPFPVIAGFLSGLGGVLIKDGIAISASSAPSIAALIHVIPAILFAVIANVAKRYHISPNVTFPLLIVGSILGYHIVSFLVSLEGSSWLFNWSPRMLEKTPRWYSWAELEWLRVDWSVLGVSFFEIVPTLLLLISLKYSVLIGSLSTVFQLNVDVDVEIQMIGQANIAAGFLGCCGGTHYVSAMALMANFKAHPRAPVLICAGLLILLWLTGLTILLVIPKFVFGGLLIYIGLHFLENYLVAPASFLSRLELLTIFTTLVSFLIVGVLPSVGMGLVLSMLHALLGLHVTGCVKDCIRVQEQSTLVLHLHGFLSFANAMQLLTIVQTEWAADPFATLVLNFEHVLLVDGSFIQILRRIRGIAERNHYAIHLCHVPSQLQPRVTALNVARHESFHHFLDAHHTPASPMADTWRRFISEQHVLHPTAAAAASKYLDSLETLQPQTMHHDESPWTFLCQGHMEVIDASVGKKVGEVHSGDVVPRVPGLTILTTTTCVVLRIRAESWQHLQRDAPGVAISMLEARNANLVSKCFLTK